MNPQCIPVRAGGPPPEKVLRFICPGWFVLCSAVAVDTFLTSSPTVTLFVPLCVFLGVLVFSVVLGGRVNTVALRHPSDVVQTIKLR